MYIGLGKLVDWRFTGARRFATESGRMKANPARSTGAAATNPRRTGARASPPHESHSGYIRGSKTIAWHQIRISQKAHYGYTAKALTSPDGTVRALLRYVVYPIGTDEYEESRREACSQLKRERDSPEG